MKKLNFLSYPKLFVFKTLFYCILLILGFFSCKNWSKTPQVRYDLSKERKQNYENKSKNDTIIFITLGGGYKKDTEHNYYSISKLNSKTTIQRTSNFQKFKTLEIESIDFPWSFLFENYNKLKNDRIVTEIRETENGLITIRKISGSHGKTSAMKIKINNFEHEFYLAPFIEEFNKDNKNIILLRRIKSSILKLNFEPVEKIKYKLER